MCLTVSVSNAWVQWQQSEVVCLLLQGLDASLIGVLPYAALRLGLYDGFKWSYRKFTKKEHVPPGMSMTFGALSGLLSASATFPLEVVR